MATRSTKTAPKTTKTAPKAATKAATSKVSTATAAAKPMATTPTAPNATIIPKATVIETLRPSISEAPIKKPEFIDRVVLETGLKKKDVKPVVEAMLDVMARALTSGEDLTIPPLGKLMIKRTKDTGNATIVTIKLRHPTGGGGGGGNGGHKNDPLADELI